MIPFRFKHVCLESVAINLPPHEMTSAAVENRLAPIYERLKIPFGTLEKLSGVKTRYLWEPHVNPSEIALPAAQSALEQIGFDREHIRAVFSCSVTRDYFEPATACIIHHELGLPETSLAMDISNACIGFSNGLMTLAGLIESGVVKAGVVASGEAMGRILERNFEFVLERKDTITREDFIRLLPTYTLGAGGVAYVLCHDSIATKKHRFLGGAARSATQFNDLCEGNGDYFYRQARDFNPIMYTESSKLISSAAELGGRTWRDASEVLGWSREEIDHIFCHQVGRQVNEAFYREMGLDLEKEFTIYRKYGNLVSAALPTCLAMGIEGRNIQKGDKILLTAFGSGLNAVFTGIEW